MGRSSEVEDRGDQMNLFLWHCEGVFWGLRKSRWSLNDNAAARYALRVFAY